MEHPLEHLLEPKEENEERLSKVPEVERVEEEEDPHPESTNQLAHPLKVETMEEEEKAASVSIGASGGPWAPAASF